jgi:hypothetical protein
MHPARQATRRCRGRGAIVICLAIAGAFSGLPSAQAGVTKDNFLARTTDDFVTVCSALEIDPLYRAAVNFCEGFAVGTYQVLQEVQSVGPKFRLFCFPDPGPSRNEVIASFVTWAKAHPEQGARLPVESVASFLAETYPCPVAAPARPASVKKR